MLKKFKKKRQTLLRPRERSKSLRDINVVGSFVFNTAKIISASVESLKDDENDVPKTASLVCMLDHAFQPTIDKRESSSLGTPKKRPISVPNQIYDCQNEYLSNSDTNEYEKSAQCSNIGVIEEEPLTPMIMKPLEVSISDDNIYKNVNYEIKSSPFKKYSSLDNIYRIFKFAFQCSNSAPNSTVLSITNDDLEIKSNYNNQNTEASGGGEELTNTDKIKNIVTHPLFIAALIVGGLIFFGPKIKRLFENNDNDKTKIIKIPERLFSQKIETISLNDFYRVAGNFQYICHENIRVLKDFACYFIAHHEEDPKLILKLDDHVIRVGYENL